MHDMENGLLVRKVLVEATLILSHVFGQRAARRSTGGHDGGRRFFKLNTRNDRDIIYVPIYYMT